jgi:hypothetical protein
VVIPRRNSSSRRVKHAKSIPEAGGGVAFVSFQGIWGRPKTYIIAGDLEVGDRGVGSLVNRAG